MILLLERGYFVERVGEELQPVFGLIEDLRDKDEGRAIGSGGLDVNSSEFDLS
jgi:hypothetical protein